MEWLSIGLWVVCILGIKYADTLIKNGKLKKYNDVKWILNKRLIPFTFIYSFIVIILRINNN